MFSIFKRRKGEAVQERVSARIVQHGKNVQRGIENQVAVPVEHGLCSREEAWADGYTRLYVFGACDALTCEFPVEIRQKVGPSIIELSFLMIAQSVFNTSKPDAEAALADVFRLQRTNPTEPSIIDGGTDGYEMMQGKPATRLLTHLTGAFAA